MLFLSSPPQRALCVIGRLGREKKNNARGGGDGKGKEKNLPIVLCAYFFSLFFSCFLESQRGIRGEERSSCIGQPCCVIFL